MIKEARYFTVKQFNKIAYEAAHAIVKYCKFVKKLDKQFKKQIMITVSNVNNCSACSHVHTRSLLKSGMSDEEFKPLFAGSFDKLSEDVSLALVFAQHYADETGNYDKEAFKKITDYYGNDKAYGIMATIKIIMFGNNNGIALTNLFNRLRFKRNKNSKFLTELYNGLFAYILLPILIIVNLFTRKKTY